MRFRCLFSALIAIACTLLVSCIEGREEIWIHANGSGRADLSYDIPASAVRFNGGEEGVRKLVGSLLKNAPQNTYEVTTIGDRLRVNVKLEFDHPGQLTKLTSTVGEKKTPAAFDHLAGKFSVTRSYRTVDFTRIVSPGKALPVSFIPPAQFKDRKLTYIIHLPMKPEESTATRTENNGQTLIWEQPLATAIRQPINIHFKAKIPIPTWLIGAVIGIAVISLLLIYRFAVKRRNGTSDQVPQNVR